NRSRTDVENAFPDVAYLMSRYQWLEVGATCPGAPDPAGFLNRILSECGICWGKNFPYATIRESNRYLKCLLLIIHASAERGPP
ncbi:MAG: hypothetical protein ACAI44_34675, partial [Candidatus Sericytochromatia bacterium]